MKMPGRVYLVGAGPGDPELLALKAARLIAQAEVAALHAGGEICPVLRAALAGAPSARESLIHA